MEEKLQNVPFMMRRLTKAHRGQNILCDMQCRILSTLVSDKGIDQVVFVDDNLTERSLFKGKTRGIVPLTIIEDPVDWSEKGCYLENPEKTLVVLDLVMPEVDGYQIGKRIRALYEDVLLVAITSSRPSESESIFSLFDAFLLKPITTKNMEMIFTTRA